MKKNTSSGSGSQKTGIKTRRGNGINTNTHDEKASKGKIWLCLVCGKTSPTKYGFDTKGWDVSCMINAKLVNKNELEQNS